MNWKIWLNLIAVFGFCFSMPAALTAQQNKVTDSKATPSKQTVQARALGQVTVISGPTACGAETCYELDVACSGLQELNRLMLKIGNASANVSARGTIMFFSGARGTNPWDGGAQPQRVVSELRAAGFRTVVLWWTSALGWSKSATGWHVGHGRLACRPATAARWVIDNLHTQTRRERPAEHRRLVI